LRERGALERLIAGDVPGIRESSAERTERTPVENLRDADLLTDATSLRLAFSAELWYWRGPSPYHFVTVTDDGCAQLKAIANDVTYGWGMIPVTVRIGETDFDTSLFQKDGRFVVPIRDVVRKAEKLELGNKVAVELRIRAAPARRPGREAEVEFDLDHPPPDL